MNKLLCKPTGISYENSFFYIHTSVFTKYMILQYFLVDHLSRENLSAWRWQQNRFHPIVISLSKGRRAVRKGFASKPLPKLATFMQGSLKHLGLFSYQLVIFVSLTSRLITSIWICLSIINLSLNSVEKYLEKILKLQQT